MQARRLSLKKTATGKKAGKPRIFDFKVLFIEDPEGWSAQVLEHDIATQADTLEDLFYEVERILFAHIALAAADGHAPFKGMPPAPKKYWDIYAKSPFVMRGPLIGLKQRTARPPRIKKHIRITRKAAA